METARIGPAGGAGRRGASLFETVNQEKTTRGASLARTHAAVTRRDMCAGGQKPSAKPTKAKASRWKSQEKPTSMPRKANPKAKESQSKPTKAKGLALRRPCRSFRAPHRLFPASHRHSRAFGRAKCPEMPVKARESRCCRKTGLLVRGAASGLDLNAREMSTDVYKCLRKPGEGRGPALTRAAAAAQSAALRRSVCYRSSSPSRATIAQATALVRQQVPPEIAPDRPDDSAKPVMG
jgi:hypothetical protein